MKLWTRTTLACLVPFVLASAQSFPPYGVYPVQLAPGGSYLGVHIIEVDDQRAEEFNMPAASGVEITSVAKGSPAEEAGIERGDVILEFRNEQVAGVEHFMRLVRETPVGRETAITLWRNGRKTTLTAKIGERKRARYGFQLDCEDGEDCQQRSFDFTMPAFDLEVPVPHIVWSAQVLGAKLESLEDQLAKHFGVEEGVLVRSVEPNSPAGRAGLKAGDVITSANGEAIRTPRQFRRVIRSAEEETITIEIMRDRRKQTLQMKSAGSARPQRRLTPQPTRRL